MHVAVQEPADVFVNRRNFVLAKDAEDNSRVGHARDLDVVKVVIDSEPLFKCKYQRVDTRAARVNQRAVDVKKQQALCSRCCPERSRGIPVNHSRPCHEIRGTQSVGACIISTAIILPRKTTSTIPRPIRIPVRTESFPCSWRRRGDALLKWGNSAPASAKLALISSGFGNGFEPPTSDDSYLASAAPNRIRSSNRSTVSVTGLPFTRVALAESTPFNRYVSPSSSNCA